MEKFWSNLNRKTGLQILFKSIIPGIIISILLTLSLSCKEQNDPTGFSLNPNETVVYSNSFESETSLLGWSGFGTRKIVKQAAPESGKRSLYISGGCFVPHSALVLPTNAGGGYFIVQCWGKHLQAEGSVVLSALGNGIKQEIAVQINNPAWKRYCTTDTLYCPPGEKLQLKLSAGGIIPGAMLVDQIRVLRVKPILPEKLAE